MDPAYAAFANRDSLFYERPRSDSSQGEFFPGIDSSWRDWRVVKDDTWVHRVPRPVVLPEQGWKIHGSATLESADRVLEVVSEYCHRENLAFKHLRGQSQLQGSLSKDADRGSAGKFVTIYPRDLVELHECLVAIDAQLADVPAPYILSDLRWNRGPLFVRYGAFVNQSVWHDGAHVPAIRNLALGVLVPDIRSAAFIVPSWVEMPEFLQGQARELQPTPPSGFPVITGALHHSNAGGVYTANHLGEAVVLKEARPHTGRTPDGRYGPARLAHEARTLSALPPGFPAPKVLDSFQLHGHQFLALERVNGEPLSRVAVARNPLGSPYASADEYAAHRDWAMLVSAQLRRAVEWLHREGITHGDLHPGNVLVGEGPTITLVDFEMSLAAGDPCAAPFGAPGFVASGVTDPVIRDEYAVACIELHILLPLTALIQIDRSKAHDLVQEAAAIFALGPGWARDLTRRLQRGFPGTETSARRGRVEGAPRRVFATDETIASIAKTLLDDATPSRSDRLWPGDPRQFGEPRFSLGTGSLGVALALASSGQTPGDDIRAWTESALRDGGARDHLGLMNGTAGALVACRRLGWHSTAEELVPSLAEPDWSVLGTDLYSGIPGIVLALLDETERQPELYEVVYRGIAVLRDRLASSKAKTKVSTNRGGLFGGASGTALLALKLHATTGDDDLLDLARLAINHDLHSLIESKGGALHVNEGWRSLPYLGHGSAGIGLILAQYLAYADDQNYESTLAGIVTAACAPFAVQAGLMQGRAGLIHFLTELEVLGRGSPTVARAIKHHEAQLWLHAARRDGKLRFAGDGLLRVSSDLSTGSAGILTALLALRGRRTGERVDVVPYLSTLAKGLDP